MSLSTAPFFRLVSALKRSKRTTTVVESSCGGLIQSSIMAIPGSSSVFWGGTVSYNTRKAGPLLLNDPSMHAALTEPLESGVAESEAGLYVRSKVRHARLVAAEYCRRLGTDYAICETGATGPTFRPAGMDRGFAAIAVAGKDPATGEVSVVGQRVVHSGHNDRQVNMRMFADEAAKLALDAVESLEGGGKTDRHDSADGESPERPYYLDRATKLRSDPRKLDELAKDASYVALRGGKSLFCKKRWELNLLTLDELRSLCDATGASVTTTFLGILDGGDAFFGADLIGGDFGDEDVTISRALGSDDARFADTRTGAPLLSSPLHNELVLHATALAQWQRRNRYSPASGVPAELVDGGTAMRCPESGAMSWPRQDPSMIAAIVSPDGDHILLARSKRHPPGLHTVLAGFVEAGETFEQAVVRETYEETGVRIDKGSVRYVGSQPWPFPQSTMIGFLATAEEDSASRPLSIDANEHLSAGWFHKDEVRAAAAVEGATMRADVAAAALEADPSLTLLIPPRGVIARKLIDTWLGGLPL